MDPGETPTGAEPVEVRTKIEDCNFFPQIKNPGNGVILTLKLDRRIDNFY